LNRLSRYFVKVLAISPAYNAEDTLEPLVDGLVELFERRDIVIVDDGSSDSTWKLAKSLGVRTIHFEKNFGKGHAVKAGFAEAIANGYEAALTIDSDLQHPPELCRDLIDTMAESGADIVIGDRMGDISTMPLQRRFSNRATSFFVRLWTGERVRDSQCGFRLIKTALLGRVDLRVERYQTETELILEAARLGAKFAYVPVPTIYNDQPSNIGAFAETLRFIGLMLGYPFRRRRITS